MKSSSLLSSWFYSEYVGVDEHTTAATEDASFTVEGKQARGHFFDFVLR